MMIIYVLELFIIRPGNKIIIIMTNSLQICRTIILSDVVKPKSKVLISDSIFYRLTNWVGSLAKMCWQNKGSFITIMFYFTSTI